MSSMRVLRLSGLLAALAAATALVSACYVVPINGAYPNYPAPNAQAAAPGPLQLTARLYPANDAASAYGVVTANIVNNLNGHGTFNLSLLGETLSGEATRTANTRSGTANAASPRGTFMRCTYTMNNATQGTGNCNLSTGAVFSMHVGG